MKSPQEKYSPGHSSEFYPESTSNSPKMRSLAPPQFKLESSSPVQLTDDPSKATMEMEQALSNSGPEPISQVEPASSSGLVPPLIPMDQSTPSTPVGPAPATSSMDIWGTDPETSFGLPLGDLSDPFASEADSSKSEVKASKKKGKASKSQSSKSEAKSSKSSARPIPIPRGFRSRADIAVKLKIAQITSGKFKVQRPAKGQQAEITGGINYALRPPTQKPAGANIARHFCSMMKLLDVSQEEAQLKVKEEEEVLEWSNNKTSSATAFADGITLQAVVDHLKGTEAIKGLEAKAQKFKEKKSTKKKNPTQAELTTLRLFNHWRKLQEEANGNYGQFQVVYTGGRSGQHGETKLTKTGGGQHIYGTMRPCLACFIYMHLAGVDTNTYNPKHGPSWDSKNARLSIVELMWEQYGKVMMGSKSQRSMEKEDWNGLVARVMKKLDWAGAGAKITSDFNVSKGTLHKGKDGNMTHRKRAFNGDTSSDDERTI